MTLRFRGIWYMVIIEEDTDVGRVGVREIGGRDEAVDR